MKRIFLLISAMNILFFADAQTWNIGSPNAADVTATLSNDTLYISGTGAMQSFIIGGVVHQPWYSNISAIKYVVVAEGVSSIGDYAFCTFHSLVSVSLPNTLTSIGVRAFDSCDNITSITIPSDVINIATLAFSSCSGLTSVTNLNSVPQNIDIYTFHYVNLSAATLIVPCGSLSAYQAASIWQNFGTIQELPCSNVSNVHANFSCPGQVTVTYNLNSAHPTNIQLLYSHDGGVTWLVAQTVTGDLTAQTTGTGKTIIWKNRTDHVLWGNFKLKIEPY